MQSLSNKMIPVGWNIFHFLAKENGVLTCYYKLSENAERIPKNIQKYFLLSSISGNWIKYKWLYQILDGQKEVGNSHHKEKVTLSWQRLRCTCKNKTSESKTFTWYFPMPVIPSELVKVEWAQVNTNFLSHINFLKLMRSVDESLWC